MKLKKQKLLLLPLSFLKSSASCLSVTISFMLTTLRWTNWRRILISLMAVIGKPSFSLSSRTFFRATSSPAKTHAHCHDNQLKVLFELFSLSLIFEGQQCLFVICLYWYHKYPRDNLNYTGGWAKVTCKYYVFYVKDLVPGGPGAHTKGWQNYSFGTFNLLNN